MGRKEWIAFQIFMSSDEQFWLLKALLPTISIFEHFNFNFYESHLSIRIHGDEKDFQRLRKALRKVGITDWKELSYDPKPEWIKDAYELGSRCAILVEKAGACFYPKDFMKHVLHGFLNCLGFSEKEEVKLYGWLWWHFAVRKPFRRMIARLRR